VKAIPPLPPAPRIAVEAAPPAPIAVEVVVPAPAAFLGLAPQFTADIRSAGRFDPAGSILESRGDADGLASLCGFLRRIVDWVGDDLGLSGFRCFEGRSSARQVLLYAEAAGSLLAFELETSADLASLRAVLAEMS
jgi:hypothetical protein